MLQQPKRKTCYHEAFEVAEHNFTIHFIAKCDFTIDIPDNIVGSWYNYTCMYSCYLAGMAGIAS